MRKKIIYLSIIVGLFLSIGLGTSKEATQGITNLKQTINSNLIVVNNGPTDPQPRVIIVGVI